MSAKSRAIEKSCGYAKILVDLIDFDENSQELQGITMGLQG